MDVAIKVNDIEKSFKKQQVLKKISMTIPKKSIFFMLGLNGAGKTTLMKIMLNLLYPDAGNIDFGDYSSELGFLIETPTFYENLTAYQNLKHHAILIGCDDSEIERVLKIVRLSPENKKPVSGYSLGMKQRLGLARALMGNFDYIILDEPLNGLDPVGMAEFKDIIKELNSKNGKTILLSSHLIKETENLATDYCIIHHGENLIQFSHEELDERCKKLHITCSDDSILKLIENTENVFYVKKSNEINVYAKNNIDDLNDLLEKINQNNYQCEASIVPGSLDEFFVALTKGGPSDVAYN